MFINLSGVFPIHRVAHVSTDKLHVEMVHRPASSNIGVKASVDQLDMTGLSLGGRKEDAPVIITTKKEEEGVCVCVCVLANRRW